MVRSKHLGCALALLTLAGCAKSHLRDAHSLARSGDYEGALIAYEQAAQLHPEDTSIPDQIEHITPQAIAAASARGFQAEREGRLESAGQAWARALELCTPRIHPPECLRVTRVVEERRKALEEAGDKAASQERWEDALGGYGAVLALHPDQEELKRKQAYAQKGFAVVLEEKASALAEADPGAALLTDLKALRYDPMQAKAFDDGTRLKKELRARTRVAVESLALDANGEAGFGKALRRAVTPHLSDFAPYGPTEDAGALQADFKATVVKVERHDEKKQGDDELPNDDGHPIRNPALAPQQAKVAELAAAVSRLEREGGSPKAFTRAKAELKEALAALAAMPQTVPAPATFRLPYQEVTRTVTATVRFQLTEPDFPEPVTLEVTHSLSRSSRSHSVDFQHGISDAPMKLPSFDRMTAELAAQFADGASVLREARARRVEARLEEGRKALAAGETPKALDAFIEVVFMLGPSGLPADAAGFLAGSMERTDAVKELVALD